MNHQNDTERAAHCPFCGSTDISDGEVLSQDPKTGRTVTQSECRSCHAIGPEAVLAAGDPDYGDVKAIAAWNRRASPAAAVEAQWLAEAERLADLYAADAMDSACQEVGIERTLPTRAALLSHLRLRPEAPTDNRTHVDSGALTLALNVLRRAGKNEVADALEATAVRPEAQAVEPKDEPVAWSQADAIRVAHAAGFAGENWSMGPEELAHLLTVAHPVVQEQPATHARMIHDFPALALFHEKYALGPMREPSCLCCGQSMQGREVGVQHMELPGIVICKKCHDAATTVQAQLTSKGPDHG